MPAYLYDNPDWPKFRWNPDALFVLLAHVRHQQGKLIDQMKGLGFGLQQQAASAGHRVVARGFQFHQIPSQQALSLRLLHANQSLWLSNCS